MPPPLTYIWVKLECQLSLTFFQWKKVTYSDNIGWTSCPSCPIVPSHVTPNVPDCRNFFFLRSPIDSNSWSNNYWKTGIQHSVWNMYSRDSLHVCWMNGYFSLFLGLPGGISGCVKEIISTTHHRHHDSDIYFYNSPNCDKLHISLLNTLRKHNKNYPKGGRALPSKSSFSKCVLRIERVPPLSTTASSSFLCRMGRKKIKWHFICLYPQGYFPRPTVDAWNHTNTKPYINYVFC